MDAGRISNDSTSVSLERMNNIQLPQQAQQNISLFLEDDGNGTFELTDIKGNTNGFDLSALQKFVGEKLESCQKSIEEAIKFLPTKNKPTEDVETADTAPTENKTDKNEGTKIAKNEEQALLNAQNKALIKATDLAPGEKGTYEIEAEYEEDGTTWAQSRKITVEKDSTGELKILSDELNEATPMWRNQKLYKKMWGC